MGITNTIAKLKSYFEAWHKAEKNSHLELIYPVGSIYMSVNDTNPEVLFGGQWKKIEGMFLLGSSNTYPLKTNNKNTTGGSKDAIIVSHTHPQKKHTHTQSSHAHNAPQGYYYVAVKNSDGTSPDLWCPNAYYNLNKIAAQTGTLRQLIVAGDTNGFYVKQPRATDTTTVINGDTIAENQYAGESGTDKNMPPYLVVNIWERTQ